MMNNRFLLGSVAFGVSFGIGLLTSRDLGKAAIAGGMTLPATYIAVAVVQRRYADHAENRIATLKSHIQALQQRRWEAYQELTEMMAEKERVAQSLTPMQTQLRQLKPASAPAFSATQVVARAGAVSWNLSEAPVSHAVMREAHELPTQIQTPLKSEEASLSQVLTEAAVTKQRIESSLNSLQAELVQLKSQISEHRQTRDRLLQEVTDLNTQNHQLEARTLTLRDEIVDLERYREELEQLLSYAELKKQELETSAHPLQAALKNLQAEINGLHAELRDLEAQVVERRQQKDALEQQLLQLKAQEVPEQKSSQPKSPEPKARPSSLAQTLGKTSRKSEPRPSKSPSSQDPSGNQTPGNQTPANQTPANQTTALQASKAVQAAETAIASSSISLPSLPKPDNSVSELPNEWTELMVQLPEPEFQVLKAIVEHRNPFPLIKRVAEDYLTMPELLIDSINERALDTVGDLVLEFGSASGPVVVVQEYAQVVKQMITTYEYLMR